MNFKRPSFRKGGSTGIDQLTPRKKFQFGTPGFQFLEPGLQNELRDAYRPTRNIGTKTITRQNIPTGGLTRGSNATRLGLKTLRNFPITSTTGLMSLPFVPSAALAYMNRPKTLEEKKVMQEYGPIDETFFQYDEYDADRKKARGVGEEISFTDALFMDPETGEYPKVLGRTKDRKKIEELFGTDAGFLPNAGPKEVNIEEIVDTMVSNKKTGTKDDDTPKKAASFEDTYEAEKKKIERLIGEDDNKGIIAIALSDAIGTPGTIADKAAVLNKALLGIMVGKKKDKKDIAKLAYTATKEIEKAKALSNKTSDSQKNFERIQNLTAIINDSTGTYSDVDKASARNQLEIIKESLNVLNPRKEGSLTGLKAAAGEIEKLNKLVKKIQNAEPGSKKYNENLQQYIAIRELLIGSNNIGVNNADARLDNALGLTTKKDGGRIKKQLGGSAMEVSETVGQGETPTAQVQQLSFSELRNRLPKEITDDVIRLLANSNEALQDFAYIRTQGDVSKFNTKYGVTLVLPAQTA